jgi:hypothetical protein
MTSVRLYEDAGFQGSTKLFKTSDKGLTDNYNPPFGNWNDDASSLKVYGGPVTFYENTGYGGAHWTLGPGSYDLGDMLSHGIPNDSISSFKFV